MDDSCTALEGALNAIEGELTRITTSWGHEIEEVGPSGKSAVVKEHKQEIKEVKGKIAAATAKFENCLKSLPRVPLAIGVSGVHCIEKQDLSSEDEPYVLVCVVNLKSSLPITFGGKTATVPIPRAKVVLTGPWPGLSSGDYRSVNDLPLTSPSRPFWDNQGNRR
jgi:hypothetical protein